MITASDTPGTGQKAARTRQRILAAATREFASNGYGGTSLRSVAAQAELHLGSLYFHFRSKDELVSEVMREGIDFAHRRVRAALEELPPDVAAEIRLQTAIRAHLEALHSSHDRGAAVVQMGGTLPPELRRAHVEYERRYGGLWLGILQEARDAGLIDATVELRLVRDLFLGALNSTLNTVRFPEESLAPVAAAAYSLLARPAGR